MKETRPLEQREIENLKVFLKEIAPCALLELATRAKLSAVVDPKRDLFTFLQEIMKLKNDRILDESLFLPSTLFLSPGQLLALKKVSEQAAATGEFLSFVQIATQVYNITKQDTIFETERKIRVWLSPLKEEINEEEENPMDPHEVEELEDASYDNDDGQD